MQFICDFCPNLNYLLSILHLNAIAFLSTGFSGSGIICNGTSSFWCNLSLASRTPCAPAIFFIPITLNATGWYYFTLSSVHFLFRWAEKWRWEPFTVYIIIVASNCERTGDEHCGGVSAITVVWSVDQLLIMNIPLAGLLSVCCELASVFMWLHM